MDRHAAKIGGRSTGEAMFFLLRMGFWGSLLLLLLPIGGGDGSRHVTLAEAIAAAVATAQDLGAFCERNPATCATGVAAAETVRDRARVASRMIADHLGAGPTPPAETVADHAPVDPALQTGSIRPVVAVPAPRPKPEGLAETPQATKAGDQARVHPAEKRAPLG